MGELVENRVSAELAGQVLFTLMRAEKVDTIPELNGLFQNALRPLGFDLFAYCCARQRRRRPELEVIFGQGFAGWLTCYAQEGFARDDPILKEAERCTEPFYWSEMTCRTHLSSRAQNVLNTAKRFNLSNGFVLPVHRLDEQVSLVLFAGAAVEHRNDEVRAVTRLLAQQYVRHGHRLIQGSSEWRNGGLLSERQWQCLMWVCRGKSSRDIGAILGIAPSVVDEHMRKVCNRFNVRTRTQVIYAAGRLMAELGDAYQMLVPSELKSAAAEVRS